MAENEVAEIRVRLEQLGQERGTMTNLVNEVRKELEALRTELAETNRTLTRLVLGILGSQISDTQTGQTVGIDPSTAHMRFKHISGAIVTERLAESGVIQFDTSTLNSIASIYTGTIEGNLTIDTTNVESVFVVPKSFMARIDTGVPE